MRCHPLTCRPIQSTLTPVLISAFTTAQTLICSSGGNFFRPLIQSSQILLITLGIPIMIPFSIAMRSHCSVTYTPKFTSMLYHQFTYLTSLGQSVLVLRQKALGLEHDIVTPYWSFWLRWWSLFVSLMYWCIYYISVSFGMVVVVSLHHGPLSFVSHVSPTSIFGSLRDGVPWGMTRDRTLWRVAFSDTSVTQMLFCSVCIPSFLVP